MGTLRKWGSTYMNDVKDHGVATRRGLWKQEDGWFRKSLRAGRVMLEMRIKRYLGTWLRKGIRQTV